MWRGSTCYVVGGGPSVSCDEIAKLEGRRVIVVNRAYKDAPWADVLFFWDCDFWTTWLSSIRQFAGLKVTACERHRDSDELHVLERVLSVEGIGTDPAKLHQNRSSGACAIELARHLGAKRIVLVGFDMRKVGGRDNYHSDYPKPDRYPKRPDKYAWFLGAFPAIARDLEAQGIECVNATPGSALTLFPFTTIDDELARSPVEAIR